MSEDVSINATTTKRFLSEASGLHVEYAAIPAFQKLLNKMARELAKKAGERAVAKGRKTIQLVDIMTLEASE
jgi:histone H3/H4